MGAGFDGRQTGHDGQGTAGRHAAAGAVSAGDAACNPLPLLFATGLQAPDEGLGFPPGSVDDIPQLMRLKSEGGYLAKKGVVEVISSLRPDGSSVGYDIRKGVWVCIEASSDYIKRCFKEYQVVTDRDGVNMVLYKK